MDSLGAEHDFETRGFLAEKKVYKLRKTLRRSWSMKVQLESLQAPGSARKVASVRED